MLEYHTHHFPHIFHFIFSFVFLHWFLRRVNNGIFGFISFISILNTCVYYVLCDHHNLDNEQQFFICQKKKNKIEKFTQQSKFIQIGTAMKSREKRYFHRIQSKHLCHHLIKTTNENESAIFHLKKKN